jgi:hypothetical protein
MERETHRWKGGLLILLNNLEEIHGGINRHGWMQTDKQHGDLLILLSFM